MSKKVRRVLAVCCATFHMVAEQVSESRKAEPAREDSLTAMAADPTNVPLPGQDEVDFDLFGPAEGPQGQAPVPPVAAQQPAAPQVQQVTVGLGPAMQQMMLQMMQSQQTMLEMLNKRMDADLLVQEDLRLEGKRWKCFLGPSGECAVCQRCWKQPSREVLASFAYKGRVRELEELCAGLGGNRGKPAVARRLANTL